MAQSRNVPSVKILHLAGINETLDLAEDFGIQTLKDRQRYGLALVLGGGEVKLLEMVSAFGVFANDGIKTPLNIIKEIKDPKGNVREEIKKDTIKVLSSQIVRQINNILSDNAARAPMFGLSSPLYFPGFEVAAKTGTTQNYKDAWTLGYTPSLAVGVWVGNNNNEPMAKKPGVFLSSPIWHTFMLYALPNFPKQEFKKPNETTTGNPILDGQQALGSHSILHFVDKKNPQGPRPTSPGNDAQYENWEAAVSRWLGF